MKKSWNFKESPIPQLNHLQLGKGTNCNAKLIYFSKLNNEKNHKRKKILKESDKNKN